MTRQKPYALASWLVLKAKQRTSYSLRRAKVRIAAALRATSEPRRAPSVLPWSPLAAPPGNVGAMPWSREPGSIGAEDKLAQSILRHEFRVLAPVARRVVSDSRPVRDLVQQYASEVEPTRVAAYAPIEWHSDFHSDYRWDPRALYIDIRVAPVPGADIKVPRELSRFQHIGALARGSLTDGGAEFLLQAVDWIVANPVGRGVNWACTMDVAIRAVNWIWGLRLFEPILLKYPKALEVISASLYHHGCHIFQNLEYYRDCTSNHYLANIAGLLYISAACPDFADSDIWLAFSLQELVSEMDRQVYPDGADYEASTHYHRLVADMFVSCASVAERLPAARRQRLARLALPDRRSNPPTRCLREGGISLQDEGQLLPQHFYVRLARMAEFTAALTKPNGLVPQFGDNDSARLHFLRPSANDDILDHAHLPATVGELLNRADLQVAGNRAFKEADLVAGDLRGRVHSPPKTASGRSSLLFANAGIAVTSSRSGWMAVTCGANGQGGRGGHGHNDKNSFELNIAGLDIIVDGGCPAYTSFPDVRNRFRSTAAHSTIAVEGVEQDRWVDGSAGLFRLSERSNPRLQMDLDGSIIGEHSGYGPIHRRRFDLRDGALRITDEFADDRPRWLNFNLHPEVEVELQAVVNETAVGKIRREAVEISFRIEGVADSRIDPGSFGVGYGQPVANKRLGFRLLGPLTRSDFQWVA